MMRLSHLLAVAFGLNSVLAGPTEFAHEPKKPRFYEIPEPMSDKKLPDLQEKSTHPMDNPNWRGPLGPEAERHASFWVRNGQSYLQQRLDFQELNRNVAKNVVIFIGDGMSLATQMATRAYLGDENTYLSFEKFPYTGLSRTYAVNYQVPDSANTANAIMTGVKNNYGTVGLNGLVRLGNCTAAAMEENHLKTILRWAQEAGKSTGIITNTRITHATPSSTYAQIPDRDFENDVATPEGCVDIARQLVEGETGRNLNVVLGCGSREFIPKTQTMHGGAGKREDGRNLVEEWKEAKAKESRKAAYVQSRAELRRVNGSADYLFGHFASNHCPYHSQRDPSETPSLLEMVQQGLSVLQKNDNGFVLMVEGGLIDQAHHQNWAQLALQETDHFSQVIQHVREATDEQETLMVVTADHSHCFTVGGYPERKADVLRVGEFSREDSLPILTLNYANGMGYFDHFDPQGGRLNPDDMRTSDPNFRFPASAPIDLETHGGDDVGVYANGPWAHLLVGNFEQSYIFHALMYASCLGDDSYKKADACKTSDASSVFKFSASFMVLPLLTLIRAFV